MWSYPFPSAKILIVDDEQGSIRLLERTLREAGGGQLALKSTTDPRRALPLYEEFQPDLILLDLQMPHLDGFEVMRQLQARVPKDGYLPILILTGDVSDETKKKALALGAKDFLTKPFDPAEILLRINNLLETRLLHARLHEQMESLEEKVLERTRELEEVRIEILDRLALAAEYRDDATGRHTRRVGRTSATLARYLGHAQEFIELIRRAAPLHDLGKIGIPDQILLKAGKLTPEEFELLKTHTTIGAKIAGNSRHKLLQMAEEIALYHHERWNGTGYARVAGEAIPLPARIVTVADVFDALTHDRPYKKAWPVEKAAAEIERQSGRQFDPQVVEAFRQAFMKGIIPDKEIDGAEPDLALKGFRS